ncbi:hypothetical protein ACSVIJ_04005 [Pseudomonas sp. NCHU5208]|uniref:hypothetical protein n=1 Tax=unclassified Pseudomonas TaxID=196821 RepID=UPI003F9B7A07
MPNPGAISEQADRKLEALRGLPTGAAAGRPLTLSEIGVDPADTAGSGDHYLRLLFRDIGEVVGADFIESLDPVLLEQFCVMSVTRNEPGGEILRALIQSFMTAYARRDSADDAMVCLANLLQAAEQQPDNGYLTN